MIGAMQDQTMQLSMFAEDFSLYQIGTCCLETGIIAPEKTPKFVIAATTIKDMIQSKRQEKK